ncbi:MAG: hypothetical protein AAFY46_04265 [Planctomycetota bacterium]
MLAQFGAIDSNDMIPVVAIIAGCGVGAVAIIGGVFASISQRKQIERSRREIAAYIAEGSMTPEEGEKLLNAGADPSKARKA